MLECQGSFLRQTKGMTSSPTSSAYANQISECSMGNQMSNFKFSRTFSAAAAFGVISAGTVVSALAADASNGERLARRWCAACHVVTLDQRQANADAPPFEEIAKRSNFSELGLVTFLLDPHSKMPNMNLSRSEAADIAAYVHRLQ